MHYPVDKRKESKFTESVITLATFSCVHEMADWFHVQRSLPASERRVHFAETRDSRSHIDYCPGMRNQDAVLCQAGTRKR